MRKEKFNLLAMNNISSYFILIHCSLCLLIACTPTESTSPNTTSTTTKTDNTKMEEAKANTVEEKVAAIRNLYKNIQDNLGKYTNKHKSYASDLEVPIVGELTAFMDGSRIVKLVDKAEEDHGPSVNEYFFINSKLFFLFSQVTTVEMTEKPNSHVRELRLYFDEGQIIDALVKTKTFKHGETIDMSTVANEKGTSLIGAEEEAEYYTQLASETLEFFESKESFDEFYGGE